MPHPQDSRGLTEVALEAVRSAALGAAPDGVRAFVIASADRDAIRGALEEDGLSIAIAPDAKTLVGRANGTLPLGGAGPTALARAARAALADGTVSVLFLEDAGAADPVTARFWWTLAVLLSQDDAPNGVLIAACGPRTNEAWETSASAVRGLVAVRELHGMPVAALSSRATASRSPSGRSRRTATPARRALLRATAGVLRGSPPTVEAAASEAAASSALADDAGEAAAAELALALRAFPGDRPEPFLRALALARIAGDARLATAAGTALRVSSWLRGDFAAVREARSRVRELRAAPQPLPRAVARALADLQFASVDDRTGESEGADAATFAARAEAHERAGRRAVAARLFACAAAAQGQPFRGATWERARRLWEIADPRLAAAVLAASSPGLGSATLPPGAAGIAEALRACATLATARDTATGSALELACQLVPCRSATLSSAEGVTLAARGAAALSLGRLRADGDATGGGSAPHELSAGTTLRVALARSADDPPFSRDERRLAAAIAELAAAVVSSVAPSPIASEEAAAVPDARAKKKKRPLEPLDDRLSEVERGVLVEALLRNGNNLSRTARTLGLSRNGLKMKLARHGLPRGVVSGA